MLRKIVLLTVLLVAGAPQARALELTNVRATTGPLGSKREETKFFPGDVIVVRFDVVGLKIDAKEGTTLHQIKMEIYMGGKEKAVHTQTAPPKKTLVLGADRLPAFAAAILDAKQPAGTYKMKVTVYDLLAKDSKDFEWGFEVLPPAFAIVQPVAVPVGFVGQDYVCSVALVGMKRDRKTNLPILKTSLQVFDESGKAVYPKPIVIDVLALHDPVSNDLSRREIIPIVFSIFLNRPGTYSVQVEAEDEVGKQKKQIRLPLKVLDMAAVFGGS